MNDKPRNSEGIICPVKGKRDPHVAQDALMVMIPSELRFLAQETKAEKLPFGEMSLYHLFQTMEKINAPLTLAGPFLGAPHAVIAMEKLIVLGAKRIWVLGWCGSLQPDLLIGHLIIPTGAVSEEGTSSHYPILDRTLESNKELNCMLEEALLHKGLPFSKGSVWTTDAPYRETPDKVKAYRNKGILAVEMEISALMTVALYRSVAMAGLLVVSDELFELTWRPGFSNPLLKKNSRAAGKVLLGLAGTLTHENTLGPEL
ncbi:MAG: nucleoside phosphorylase [Desulfobacteraceae bacterium]|nr:MAG: nucleoside phosphorylase [Desulfobacteraceae bacterium]